jgi:hypothetical protein
MMGRGVLLVAAAAVVAALVVFAVWLTAVATVVARPPKSPVPITNGTYSALYNATVICGGGRKTWDLTLVYRNGKLIKAMLDGREIPLAVFKYLHEFSYAGELLLDLNRIKDVNNETLKPLGGIINKRIGRLVPHADSPLAPRSELLITTSFNYSRLVIEGHSELRNVTVSNALLSFDYEAGVPYFFLISTIHVSMREFCGTSFAHITAYLREVKLSNK